jgi:hypothetical protein
MFMSACVSAPKAEAPRYEQHHYTFSVLLTPDQPKASPHLEIGLSLIELKYSTEQARYLNNILYAGKTYNEYKDFVLTNQREVYRTAELAVSSTGDASPVSMNWKYRESIAIRNPQYQGIVIEREKEFYTGGAHGNYSKKYYVVDLDDQRVINIENMFSDYRGEQTRSLILGELRRYSGLLNNEPLSSGIFLTDDPDLSTNFFVTEDGVGLHWDTYEIAPYSEGNIEIILPWRVIRPLLVQSAVETMAKFGINFFVPSESAVPIQSAS